MVPRLPFALIVNAGCAESLPARKTPPAVCKVPLAAVDGNSAGEEITPVATAGTPDAASDGIDTGQPGRGEAVCVVASVKPSNAYMRPEVLPVLPWISSVPTTMSRSPSPLMSPTAGVSATLAGRESALVVGS